MLPENLDQPGSRKSITLPKLLIVEGRSAFQFFKALLTQLSLLDQIEIRNYGGVDDLSDYLETLPVIPGFPIVTSLGIVRDAEDQGVDSAFQSVCSGLHRANLTVPDRPMAVAGVNPAISIFDSPEKRCMYNIMRIW